MSFPSPSHWPLSPLIILMRLVEQRRFITLPIKPPAFTEYEIMSFILIETITRFRKLCKSHCCTTNAYHLHDWIKTELSLRKIFRESFWWYKITLPYFWNILFWNLVLIKGINAIVLHLWFSKLQEHTSKTKTILHNNLAKNNQYEQRSQISFFLTSWKKP